MSKLVQATQKVELILNDGQKEYFDKMCDYRRYCWNKALAIWNEMYEAYSLTHDLYVIKTKINKLKYGIQFKPYKAYINPSPTWQSVKAELNNTKQDWEYFRSSRALQLACRDLGKAWKQFFDKTTSNRKPPKFKSKREARQGFKSDCVKVIYGKLVLDLPRELNHYLKEHDLHWWKPITTTESLKMKDIQTVSFIREKGKYYAAIAYQKIVHDKVKTDNVTGVDVNVKHYDDLNGVQYLFSKRLNYCYHQIAYYQRRLAKKRITNPNYRKSNKYIQTKTKLNYWYSRAKNIQMDWLHKYTTNLINNYDTLVIEDLNVNAMKMGVASKSIHRAMFGEFRRILIYKCQWYGRKLIIANRFYPSTQRCANCGFVKTGDEKITLFGNQKHHTDHNTYICYNCGYRNQRDANAMLNLTYLGVDDDVMDNLLKTY